MSTHRLVNQAAPDTPPAGQTRLFVDPVSKLLGLRKDDGEIVTLADVTNASIAAQGPGFAADTYLVGSDVRLGNRLPKARTLYQCTFDVSKTAAGTATPIIILRIGTAGSTADAARVTFTFPAQTAVADVGTFSVWVLFRSVGAAGIVQGRANLVHRGPTTGLTGLSVEPGPTVQAVSAAFDTAIANSIIGLSVNGGTSAAWTVQLVEAKVENI
jgi:hypothetical protein